MGNRYPDRKVSPLTIGYYSSQEKAIEAIQRYISQFGKIDKDVLGYEIRKFSIDVNDFDYGIPIYVATYLHDGSFNDENFADEQGVFHGRPANKVRFQPGDIVEVIHCGYARLGVVTGVPPTIERCTLLATPNIHGRYSNFDQSNDQYTVSFPDGEFSHGHIESQYVFTPTKPISTKLRVKLMEYYSKFTK